MEKKRRIVYLFLIVGLIINLILGGCRKQVEILDIELKNWRFTSGIKNNIIIVNYKENVVLSCKTDNGRLYTKDYVMPIDKIETTANEEIYWDYMSVDGSRAVDAYIDIIMRSDKEIIGFAVIKVNQSKDSALDYRASILKSELLEESMTELQLDLLIKKLKIENQEEKND